MAASCCSVMATSMGDRAEVKIHAGLGLVNPDD
jgi:hypothetical protein